MNINQESAKAIKEQRTDLIQEMKVIRDKLKAEKRLITQEENDQLSKLDEQQEEMAKRAETLEKIEHINQLDQLETRNQIISSPYHQGAKPYGAVEERNKALQGWFYRGSDKQKPEYWRAAERAGIDINTPTLHLTPLPWNRGKAISPDEYESRVTTGQVTNIDIQGGNLVSVDNSLLAHIDVATKWFGTMLQTSTVIDTQTGAPMPYSTFNDTGNEGEYTPEQASVTQLDMAFGKNSLGAYKITSHYINVSWELMQDNMLGGNFIPFLGAALGERIGRKLNKEILNGAGGGVAIDGVLNHITVGATSTSTAAAGPTYADLIALEESIDESYQTAPGFGFMFHQGFRGLLRSMVDESGRPLLWSLNDNLASGIRQNVLNGFPYYINNAFPSWGHAGSGTGATGNVAAIAGDLKKIIVRRVVGGDGGVNLVRNDYIFGLKCETVFFCWGRWDALYSDSGNHPIKSLISPTT